MHHIQDNAGLSVRNLLKDVSQRFAGQELSAIDYMDDGSPIQLNISIDGDKGEAIFDFEGTGPEVYGIATSMHRRLVTYSAIIYCLRCLISADIPLNQGCLKPIHVRIPPGSLLSPSESAAVSQRVTDVILRCFQACAASQGDTNNLTFGFGGNMPGETEMKGVGYYETVFERRYPVILQEFSLRPNSGGNGQHRGGDGVVRDIEFRIPVQVSILSERRVYHPYGLEGGEDAQCGQNIWVRRVKKQDGSWETRYINLGAKNSVQMQAGERIIIRTPGGGWGQIGDQSQLIQEKDHRRAWRGGSIANNTATQEASM
ncbi:unnamed protein product [Penicillium egyptiacum]|uniref:Hydantoinase B/oxoprolinase domain-containing protein n=1 Tax=Penicillium egyptiacum TaxID=1303716 RepID=A0A9W4K5H7_9EURO|nr:unnamed protein product [Penicillium egyptiacum]